MEHLQAAELMKKSFYIDDGLTGADSVQEAIKLQRQLQDLLAKGGFFSASGTAMLVAKDEADIPKVTLVIRQSRKGSSGLPLHMNL